MSKRIRLGDDGTLDTVVVCTVCGEEARYNYDPCGTEERAEELRIEYFRQERKRPNPVPERIEERVNETLYDEFVSWAIADFDNEHACEPTPCE